MDSLTQIVLGAAVGEVALGKKVGNRAMLWGAIGGTIPDLDIILGPFISEVDALAIHRGFSHSISFAIIGAFLFGGLVYQLYKSPYYKWIALTAWSLLFGSIAVGIVTAGIRNENYWPPIIGASLLLGFVFKWLRRRYSDGSGMSIEASYHDWRVLFFWALLTHPLLDCFTMYGTQLFAPFSDYRVAFSTISVADPAYTAPFLICLIIASFFKRGSKARIRWNWAGIIISSLYLTFTCFNKMHINNVFERQLAEQEIQYDRCISGPSILNNILWSATIENDSVYYQGQYSMFDTSPIQFNPINKNHDLIDGNQDDRTIRILKWFSKDFYNIITRKDGRLQFNDLRYGTFRGQGGGENDYIFRFIIEKQADNSYEMQASDGGPPPGEEKEMMSSLWNRIKGI